jgi:hypothetical protein
MLNHTSDEAIKSLHADLGWRHAHVEEGSALSLKQVAHSASRVQSIMMVCRQPAEIRQAVAD